MDWTDWRDTLVIAACWAVAVLIIILIGAWLDGGIDKLQAGLCRYWLQYCL